MALFLAENDVRQVLTATMALEAVESAHRDLAQCGLRLIVSGVLQRAGQLPG